MTKDEIKKSLEYCLEAACTNCSYLGSPRCFDTLCKDALNLIVEQEQEIARLKDENKQLHTNAEEPKILLVEDGSIDFDDLAMFIDEHDLKIKIVVYRQGSVPPRFLNEQENELWRR